MADNLSLEDVFKLTEKEMGSTIAKLEINGKEIPYGKNLRQCGTLKDLEKIGKQFTIHNLYNPNQIIRTIEITKESVRIDATDGKGFIDFPKSTPVAYEEWFLDRGSYLIWVDFLNAWGKLATEHDPIKILT